MSEVITIDGPVSSGKNSVGQLLAQKLGFKFIDSGSIFRIFSIYILNNNLSLDNEQVLAEALGRIKIQFEDNNGQLQVLADNEDITDRLHSPEVTELVPKVASKAIVREAAKRVQHHLGETDNTVITGRDIGSEIFPGAKIKFYLDADLAVRAKRRYQQLKEDNPEISLEEVTRQIEERDKKDMEREVSPLRIPKGAVMIDNTDTSVGQTVDKMLKAYQALPKRS